VRNREVEKSGEVKHQIPKLDPGIVLQIRRRCPSNQRSMRESAGALAVRLRMVKPGACFYDAIAVRKAITPIAVQRYRPAPPARSFLYLSEHRDASFHRETLCPEPFACRPLMAEAFFPRNLRNCC